MPNVKENVKDSVFTCMFSNPKYLVQLYHGLHPEDNITEDDLSIVSIENVLINGIYNDMGFTVKDKLVVLVEAQSTWSENIIIRMLIYLGKTYQDYIFSNEMRTKRLYSKTKLKLPEPELYVIYTGDQGEKPSALSMNDIYFKGEADFGDLKAKVIFADDDRKDIIGQYITFCTILRQKQEEYNGDKQKAVQETIKFCIKNGILEEYLSLHQKEVEEYMFALLREEEQKTYAIDSTKLDALEAFVRSMKNLHHSFEEIHSEVRSNEFYDDISETTIKEFYDEV